jgi:hypothetical protein
VTRGRRQQSAQEIDRGIKANGEDPITHGSLEGGKQSGSVPRQRWKVRTVRLTALRHMATSEQRPFASAG